ncbi:MAG: hypothetical protein PHD02_00030 [Bacilli bacterium]|nr:hypothetical protein [Bacilli bacterium]
MIGVPNDSYTIDVDCANYLYNTLKNYVIYQAKRYSDIGITIWLHDNKHRIKYNHHIYNICVIKQNNLLYFYLRPYKNKYLLLLATDYNIYENLITAIIEL